MEMPCLLLRDSQIKSVNNNKKLTFPESCKTGKADLSSLHVLVLQRRNVGAAMPAEENNSLSSTKQGGHETRKGTFKIF